MTVSFNQAIDIATIIIACVAAAASVYTVVLTKRNDEKKDLLEHFTTERLKNVHDIKHWAGILLREASIALQTCSIVDRNERISSILEAVNNLWFIFKPVYEIDRTLLTSLYELESLLLSVYKLESTPLPCELANHLREKRNEFRKLSFLYAHSGWTCVKSQIFNSEKSSYSEFRVIYLQNKKTLDTLPQNRTSSDWWNA